MSGTADHEPPRAETAVLDLVPDLVLVTDPSTWQVTYANDAACRHLGYSRTQLLALRTPQLRPELSDERRQSLISELLAHPGAGHRLSDVTLRRSDGGDLRCESHSAAITDATGRPVTVHVLRDLSERLDLIDQARRAADSFRQVFEHAPVGAVVTRVVRGRRRVLRVNAPLTQILGEPATALVGRSLARFIDPRDAPVVAERLTAVARGDEPEASGVWRFVRRDGRRLWLDVRIVPIRLPDLTGPLVLAYLADVTERQEAAERRTRDAAVSRLVAEVATGVLAGDALGTTCDRIVHGVAAAFGAVEAAVVLPDPSTGRYTVAAAHGPITTRLLARGDLPAQEFLAWLADHARHGTVVPPDAPHLPAGAASVGPLVAAEFATTPAGSGGLLLVARGRDDEPPTADDVDALSGLVQQLTLAIRWGQLQSEQRENAARRDAYLAALDDALRPLSDPDDVLAAACRHLGRHLGAARVLYAGADGEQVTVVRRQYTHGVDPLPLPVPPPVGDAVRDRARSGAVLVVDDLEADASYTPQQRELFARGGVRAAVVVPLVKGGRFIGVLSVHSDGPRRWTEPEVQLVRDTAERTWAAAERAYAEDASVSERARRQAAEHALVEQAARERRERLEQEFVVNASHELRTPVTGILAVVEALDTGAVDDPERRRRFLTHLRRESTRLARLSDSLLLLAQAQSLGTLPTEAIPVVDLLTRITTELKVAEDVEVSLEVDPLLTLRANPGLTEIVIGNLASNAARFTAVGAVRMCARSDAGQVVIEVHDTGPGMDSSTLERARDRFYRNPTTRDHTGFGLGLSIAARAATAMGATLDLTSTPGRGTCGRLTCPAVPPTTTGEAIR